MGGEGSVASGPQEVQGRGKQVRGEDQEFYFGYVKVGDVN